MTKTGMSDRVETRQHPSRGMDGPWTTASGQSADEALVQSQATFKVLTDAMPQMVWSTRPDGFHDYYNARWYEFTGVPAGSTDGEGWSGMFHPEDQDRAWTRWRHSLETGDPYEIEYRLRRRDGVYCWTLGRALPVRDEEGRIVRWIGTCTDIDDAKRGAEQNELLSRELSHRIKNIFAVISGLIGLSSRHEPQFKPFARSLQARIAALGRAHEFARPHSEKSRPIIGASTLQGLLNELFQPYPAFDEGRISLTGVDAALDDRGATPIALTFHELATNAAKYGALSTPEGQVVILIAQAGDNLSIVWREQGGPAIEGPPEHAGFGGRLADLSIVQQLGGAIRRIWAREGLIVEVDLLASRLSR